MAAKSQQKCALMLTGGGAQAAYQVGVLKAIAEWYPRVHHAPFSIYCGTSAGAINATAVASYNACFRLGVKKLDWFWRRLHTNRVFAATFTGVSKHILGQVFGRMRASYLPPPTVSLLDNQPLRSMLNEVIHYPRLEQQIRSQVLDALAVTVSSYQSGVSMSFYQGQGHFRPWTKAKHKGRPALIRNDHLLASAAIPLLFPAVKIGDSYFGDGSIHQLSPLSPAIKLGADKILIISVTPPRTGQKQTTEHPPGLGHISGHLLDTIFSDALTADIEQLERTNLLIRHLTERQKKSLDLRHIDVCLMAPQRSFAHIARQFYGNMPIMVRVLMRLLGISPRDDASITSFLLFEPAFIRALIEQGYQDAQKNRAKLHEFLEISK
ncbi:hypothetical protein VST7929_02126 [Vibrio stylophorae]|uniref:PNPLA domain-containing protein n=1 Tax=Vibrio stylophorae TaxID=659351 RepID=A0ABM8ZV67_9VIBR|nr:patatin-like phospholipase family protein [Vibrio stylophorae]CAH0534213.1 hypothetical protein VST7929_02126 [Vibrio stylophorae]